MQHHVVFLMEAAYVSEVKEVEEEAWFPRLMQFLAIQRYFFVLQLIGIRIFGKANIVLINPCFSILS